MKATGTAWLQTPQGKRSGVTPEMIQGVTSRKDLESLMAHVDPVPKPGKGAGGPAKKIVAGDASTLPENRRAYFLAVVRGDEPPPSGRTPQGRAELDMIHQYKPDFDSAGFDIRKKTQEDFTTGKVGQGVNALNTAIAHLDELEKSLPDTSNAQTWNHIKSQWLEKSGNAVNRPFDVARSAVSSELAKAYSSGVATEGEVKGFMDQLTRDSSPEQLHATAATFKRFLNGKIQAYKQQWKMGAGDRPIPGGLLSPEAQSSLGAGAQQAAPAETKMINGKVFTKENGQWVTDG